MKALSPFRVSPWQCVALALTEPQFSAILLTMKTRLICLFSFVSLSLFAETYRITNNVINDARATITASSSWSDDSDTGGGYSSVDTPCTFTASTTDETMEFQYWYGDVPYENRYDNPLTIAATSGGTINAFFGKKVGTTYSLNLGTSSNKNFFDTSTWANAVIPGTNDNIYVYGTGDNDNKGRLLVPSFFAVNNVTLTNAVILINTPNGNYLAKSGTTVRDDHDGYGNRFWTTVSKCVDSVRTLSIGADIYGDVELYGRPGKTKTSAAIYLGGYDQTANSRLSIGGDLTIYDGSIQIYAGTELEMSWFDGEYAKATSTTANKYYYHMDYPHTNELFRGGNYLRVNGTTTIKTPTTCAVNEIHVFNHYKTGAAVHLDLNDLTVEKDAGISAYQGGYGRYSIVYTNGTTYTTAACPGGFGTGDTGASGSYGGRGGANSTANVWSEYITTYGITNAPIHPGAQNVGNTGTDGLGGGSIRLDCKKLTLNGKFVSTGMPNKINKGGTSGGGIFVCADEFVAGEDCLITVAGGIGNYSTKPSGGGGGRVSVCVGLSEEQIQSLVFSENHTAENTIVSPLSDILGDRFTAVGGTAKEGGRPGEEGTGVYIVNSSGKKALSVQGYPENIGFPTPGYGPTLYDAGETVAFNAPLDGYLSDNHRTKRIYRGYELLGADGSKIGSGKELTGSFVINSDMTLVFNLTEIAHAFTVSATVGGSVVTNEMTESEAGWLKKGSTLSIKAVSDSGYKFVGWDGENETGWTAQINETVSKPRTLKAIFLSTEATERTWTGNGGDNLYLNPDNWSPIGIPGVNDEVVIPAGKSVILDSTAKIEVGSIRIAETATLTVTQRLSVNTTDLVIVSDATVNDLLPLSLTVNGDIEINGTMNINKAYSFAQFDLTVKGNVKVNGGAVFTLYAGYKALDFTAYNGWLDGGARVNVIGKFDIADDAVVNVHNESIYGAPVIFKVGSLYLGKEGTINADQRGLSWTSISGTTYCGNKLLTNLGAYWGGPHGSTGGYQSSGAKLLVTYDNPYAPMMPGSCGGNRSKNYGGGSIVLLVDGAARCYGRITAEAKHLNAGEEYGGLGSGGSIWLACGRFKTSTNALFSVKGGSDANKNSLGGSGAGGRISICQGLTATQLEQLAQTETCDSIDSLTVQDLSATDAVFPSRLNCTITAKGGVHAADTGDESLPRSGKDGTIYWISTPSKATVIILR